LLCAVILGPWWAGRPVSAEVVEEIIAQVNDKIIVLSEYERSLASLREELSQGGLQGLELEGRFREQSKDTLRDLIDTQLLVQKAGEFGMSADADLIRRLDEIRRNMNLPSMEALEEAANRQGMNYEDFKENLRENILTQQVIQREVGSRVTVSPAEIQAYYDEHKAEMERKEGVSIQQIFVSTENKSEEEQPALRQKAEDVLAKAKAGQDFAELARQYSDAPNASAGGQAGFFEKGSMAPELEAAVEALQPNQVSDLIEMRYGFMILKLLSRSQAGVPPLPDVENRIYEQIYLQKVQPALREYLTRLRQETFVSTKPGYVDTGTAPDQLSNRQP
jgi:peptidyl-prolyl cis-trans isomerase SurA